MLIMTYAHARASGDGSLISRYVCQTLLIVSIDKWLTSLAYIVDFLGELFVGLVSKHR
jgi:hypothetical protein